MLLGFVACDPDEETVPMCIEDRLTDFQNTTACIGDNLASWDFRGEKVYCFAYGFCTTTQGTADVYDENCALICTLGGAAGLQTCDGVPWAENASNESTIWEKVN